MKSIYSILLILLSTLLFSACAVESDNGSDTKDETNIEDTQNISIFVDGEEQKGFISADSETKIDIENIKSDPEIIADINGEPDCAGSKVEYKESIQSGSTSKPKVLDVSIDITRIGQGEDFEKMTKNRIDQVKSLVDGELYDGIKMESGDSMILRFIGTIDYGTNGKNLPLNDRINIKLAKQEGGKMIKVSNIECVKNKRKKLIYLKFNKSDISVSEAGSDKKVNETPITETIKDEINSTQKLEAKDTEELMQIVSKEFDIRYSSSKYSQGTYILEFLDQSDVLNTDLKDVTTFMFTDANFQLHPNFMKNYANPYKVKLEELWDFTPDTYNARPQAFSSFYRHLANDPYVTSIKEKCKTNKDLYLIGTKNGTNKYFDKILEVFYTGILPSCKIKFN